MSKNLCYSCRYRKRCVSNFDKVIIDEDDNVTECYLYTPGDPSEEEEILEDDGYKAILIVFMFVIGLILISYTLLKIALQ